MTERNAKHFVANSSLSETRDAKKRGRWYIKDARGNDATLVSRLSSLSRSFFSFLRGGCTRCFRGLRGAMHTILGIRARCNNVLDTTRCGGGGSGCNQSCNVTLANVCAAWCCAAHTATSIVASDKNARNELPVMLTWSNHDKRHCMIKIYTWEEKKLEMIGIDISILL